VPTPAFQQNAFQGNAFQTGHQYLVAGDYSLGSPSFATPAVGQVVTAAAYSLGSPSFATPVVGVPTLVFHVNPYSLGSPTFGTSNLRQTHNFTTLSYSVASPTFATPVYSRNVQFSTPAYDLGGLSFATPKLAGLHKLSAASYSLSLAFDSIPSTGLIDVHCPVNAYSLGGLIWHYPRLQQTAQVDRWPSFYRNKIEETMGLLNQILTKLMSTVPPQSPDAYKVRRLCGDLAVNARMMIINGTGFGEAFRACFDAAVAAGSSLDAMDMVRTFILGLQPKTDMAIAVVQSALFFTLAEEASIVSTMTFSSRDDVATMIQRMGAAYEEVQLTMMDLYSDVLYQNFAALSAALTQHLYLTELTLPMIVTYQTAGVRTALTLAQLIYTDASRTDEIIAENKVVHPAFPPRTIRVLSQ